MLPEETTSLWTRGPGHPAPWKARWLTQPHPDTKTQPAFCSRLQLLLPKLICQIVSQMLVPHCILPAVHFSSLTFCSIKRLNFCLSNKWKMSHVVFICISYKGVEHLFMGLFSIPVSSSVKCLSFVHFSSWFFVFFVLTRGGVLYVFDRKM